MAMAASASIGRGVKGLCIATRCADVDDFIAKFQANCDDTSMFVATTSMREIGQQSPFVILLADKTAVMRGWCVVLEAWPDGENPFGRAGIRIALNQLTDHSQTVFDRLRAGATETEGEPLPPSASEPARSQHQRAATMIGFPILREPAARGSEPALGQPQPVQDGPTERMASPPQAVIDLGLAHPLPPMPRRPVVIDAVGSAEVRRTKGMRIATPCKTVDEFVDTFHSCCDQSSFFIATRSMRPVGLESAFSIDLADGQPMLRGYCTVAEAWSTGNNRFKRPGVLIRLQQLTSDSRRLLDRLLAATKAAGATGPSGPSGVPEPTRERLTRPLVSLNAALGERFAMPPIKPLLRSSPRGDATLPRLDIRPPAKPAPAAAAAPPLAPAPVGSVDDEWSAPAPAAGSLDEVRTVPADLAPLAVATAANSVHNVLTVPAAPAPRDIAASAPIGSPLAAALAASLDASITPVVDPTAINELLGAGSMTPVVDPEEINTLLAVGTNPRVEPATTAPPAESAQPPVETVETPPPMEVPGMLALGGGSFASAVGASPVVSREVEPDSIPPSRESVARIAPAAESPEPPSEPAPEENVKLTRLTRPRAIPRAPSPPRVIDRSGPDSGPAPNDSAPIQMMAPIAKTERIATPLPAPMQQRRPRRLLTFVLLILGIAAGGLAGNVLHSEWNVASIWNDEVAPPTDLAPKVIAVPVPMPVIVPAAPSPTAVPEKVEIEKTPEAHPAAPVHPAPARPKAPPKRAVPTPAKHPAKCVSLDCL